MRFDASQIALTLHTRREGMLARAGHDLRLRAARLVATRDSERVVVEIESAAIEPVGAEVDGRLRPGLLTDGDLRRITENLQHEVLRCRRFPTVRAEVFVAPLEGADGAGEAAHKAIVTVGERSASVQLRIRRDGRSVVGEATLLQSALGMTPYTALFGAIRVADAIEVRVVGPAALFAPLAAEPGGGGGVNP